VPASQLLVDALKRELRARGFTYAQVASGIRMSEASVKRMLSRNDLTLKRLDAICAFAQIELAELVRGLGTEEKLLARLTVAQEDSLVSDPRLFLVAVCVLNLMAFDEILDAYALSKAELTAHLLRLDRMGVLRLAPNNRYRLLIARTFAWIPNGPIQRTFKDHAAEYFDSDFDGDAESMLLVNGRLSAANAQLLVSRLKRVAREFSDQHIEDSRLPSSELRPLSLLLAVRTWHMRAMRDLTRER
jgi:hypothetical protein